MKVRGIIVGSIRASLHDLTPPLPFPIVATEGYGDSPMSPAVFDILKRLEGREVSLGVPSRPGSGGLDGRPMIIAPLAESIPGESEIPASEARIGDRVRAVRGPFSGKVGTIVAFSDALKRLPSGLSLTGAEVTFATESSGNDKRYFVPWLNLERIS
jgi:hypothetical protein